MRANTCAGNLLRAPLLLSQEHFDARIHVHGMLHHPAAAAAPSMDMLLRLARHIQRTLHALLRRGIAADLATDRAGIALQSPSDITERTAKTWSSQLQTVAESGLACTACSPWPTNRPARVLRQSLDYR